jgi:hypothetical protein
VGINKRYIDYSGDHYWNYNSKYINADFHRNGFNRIEVAIMNTLKTEQDENNEPGYKGVF